MSIKDEYKTINLREILNYVENPRHDVGMNELDTIKKLINKVGAQYMYNLAKDIYENGLMGSNLPILVFDAIKQKYIVYEGNRRIACLKILNNPQILNTIDKSLKQKIDNLLKNSVGTIPIEVYCYITNEEKAFLMMERIHSGEDKGRGVKAWTPKEKDIFKERISKKKSTALIIVELTEKYLKKDITSIIEFSTIKRFFSNRNLKKALELGKGEIADFTKEKIELINFLIEKSIAESQRQNVALTRLFNKASEIEAFFIPLVDEYKRSRIGNIENVESKLGQNEGTQKVTGTSSHDVTQDEKQDSSEEKIKISINKENSFVYYTNQTIDLKDVIEIENAEFFNEELLEISCPTLIIYNGIVQPNNSPGDYIVTFKYYINDSKDLVFWQDTIKISLKLLKLTPNVMQSQTVLSKLFIDKYFYRLEFEYSDKIKSLMVFLASENKNSKYSFFINIVSRMFLEFLFRMYASKVLKYDNESVDEKGKQLQGLIDHCCKQIEARHPQVFINHIQRGRKDATNKVDLLQKSIHYYNVSISNDDIQTMFSNLSLYLEYVFDDLIKEQNQTIQHKSFY